MQVKVAMYKQGWLEGELLDEVKRLADGLAVNEEQKRTAVQDIEMVVYLRWLLHWVENLDEQGKKDLRKYVGDHEDDENPVLGFLVGKYGKEEMVEGMDGFVGKVVSGN